ncbi:hypothetical protein HELRODRAFT_189601 [Helobdella robusta]|uniref:BACK domain-containing protein n=1 Tax=Helobdella robusta TaxID=6412 RepID=T1FR69_HELRO|nr:hypothetical protein HELRODRAFT_189601 [Helobdella robusta]ESN92750.1 hypothetical protein HELRODRAFT_189601 [Helobdella robusta]
MGKTEENCKLTGEIILISQTGSHHSVDKVLFHQASAYYQALINSNMKDAHFKELTLECLSECGLVEVKEYLSNFQIDKKEFKGQTTLTFSKIINEKSLIEVEEGLKGAHYLQINGMVAQYLQLLLKHLKDTTWLHILDLSNRYSLDEVAEKTLDFVCENFKSLTDHPDMLLLSQNEVSYFVESDLINAHSEIDIFNFVIKWISYDDSRKYCAEELLAKIRYSLMTVNERCESSDVLDKMNICFQHVEHNARLRNTVGVALALGGFTQKEFSTNRFQLLPLDNLLKACECNRNLDESEQTSPESNNDKSGCMRTRCSNNGSVVFRSNKKQKLPNTLCEHGACVIDNCLYVAGGQEHYCTDGRYTTNKVYVFNPVHSIWSQCSKMHVPRSLFYLGELAGHMYAVSGYTAPNTDTPTVEKYIPTEDRWCMLAPLPVRVHELAGCVRAGKLYVSGGFRGPDSGHVDLVWSYDPARDEWCSMTPLLTARSYHAMTSVGSKLVVVGGVRYLGDDTFKDLMDGEIFDFETSQWTTMLRLKMPACCSPYLLIDNCLYLFGGHSFEDSVDHNYIQKINLSKYTKETTVNACSSITDIDTCKSAEFNNYMYHLLDDDTKRRRTTCVDDDGDDVDCKTYKYEAQRIFYFSICIMNLTKRFVGQFR